MNIKSIIQEMNWDVGGMSRKGFEVKLSYGFRSRSRRFVQDRYVPVDAMNQSCWANMSPELLRDVLVRIEATENTWPARKHVAACAEVCRSWREIMKEIVKAPEVSGKLISNLRETALTDDGRFLLYARKCRRTTCTDYIISLDAGDISKGSGSYEDAHIRELEEEVKLLKDLALPNIVGANILVDKEACKLADFGASKKLVELATISSDKSMKGTPYWMAPDVIL